MLKDRFFVYLFILLFGVAGSLNALACFLESDAPGKSSNSLPTFISCLDNEGGPFLLRADQRHENSSSKIDKQAPNVYGVTGSFRREPGYSAPARPSGAGFFPFSIPLYQLKTTYLI